jgi:hypothetical protein
MHLHRYLKGLDELAMETAAIGVSAIIAIVVFSYALNSRPVQSLASVPVVGPVVTGLRAVVGQVARS